MARKKSDSGKKGTTKKTASHNIDTSTKSKRTTGATIKKKKKKVAINIRRSSGRTEKFNLDRMAQTTSRSGVPFMMARDISKNVSKKISSDPKRIKKRKRQREQAGSEG